MLKMRHVKRHSKNRILEKMLRQKCERFKSDKLKQGKYSKYISTTHMLSLLISS